MTTTTTTNNNDNHDNNDDRGSKCYNPDFLGFSKQQQWFSRG